MNDLLDTNIFQRDLLKNYINKIYLNKVNYNGKMEIYINKKKYKKNILNIMIKNILIIMKNYIPTNLLI